MTMEAEEPILSDAETTAIDARQKSSGGNVLPFPIKSEINNPQALDAHESNEPAQGSKLVKKADKWQRTLAGLPPIIITKRELPEITADAINALNRQNDPPRLFILGGSPVRIERNENGVLTCKPITPDIMRREGAEVARWIQVKINKETEEVTSIGTSMPRDIAINILATPELPFPALRGIVAVPHFTADGALITTNGYNKKSKLFLDRDKKLVIPTVNTRPTATEIKEAVDTLADVVMDFPFDSDASRAHALAVALLPFAREMIQGPTPLHLFDAPTPGSGKTLNAKVVLIPGCGLVPVRPLAMKKWKDAPYCDDEEIRKAITSLLLQGHAAAIFDNVRGHVESASLELLLTSSTWGDRVLGSNTNVSLPNRTTWCMSANNATLSTDLVRRTISIRLDTSMERPQERSGFRHPNIETYALANRGKLAWACLTLLSAWIHAGQPPAPQSLGGFEGWSHVIGGTLTHAGINGFLGNTTNLQESADDEGAAMREFVRRWFIVFQANESTASALLLVEQQVGAFDLGVGDETTLAKRLGKRLASKRGRVYDGLKITSRPARNGTVWYLQEQARA